MIAPVRVSHLLHKKMTTNLQNLETLTDVLVARVKACDPLAVTEPGTRFRPRCRPKLLDQVMSWDLVNPPADGSRNKPPLDEYGRRIQMHWCTYMAIVRRNGGPYKSGGEHAAEYDWIGDMATLVLKEIVERWESALHQQLPREAEDAKTRLVAVWNASLYRIHRLLPELLPQHAAYLGQQLRAVMVVRDQVISVVENAMFTHAQAASRLIDKKIRETLTDGWFRVFRDGTRAKGRGSYRERRVLFEHFARRRSTDLIKRTFAAMSKEVAAKIDLFRETLIGLWKDTRAQVKSLVHAMMKTIVTSGGAGAEAAAGDAHQRVSYLPAASGSQDEHTRAINNIILQWENEWNAPRCLALVDASSGGIGSSVAMARLPDDYIPLPDTINMDGLLPDIDSDGDADPKEDLPSQKRGQQTSGILAGRGKATAGRGKGRGGGQGARGRGGAKGAGGGREKRQTGDDGVPKPKRRRTPAPAKKK